MAIDKDVLAEISKWTGSEWEQLRNLFPAEINGTDIDTSITRQLAEKFDNGTVCPFCGQKHIIKYGKTSNGRQRYQCKDCKKSFVSTTGTILWHSNLKTSVWDAYIGCMKEGLTLEESAERCGVSTTTSFYMRHRIMEAMDSMCSDVNIGGIIEADGTYYPYSLKGNRSDLVHIQENRDPHKRGKEDSTRGLSASKVCIVTAMNRDKVPFLVVTGRAKPTADRINEMMKDHIVKGSILCTDDCNEYNTLAKDLSLEQHKIPSKEHVNGKYHIQSVNSLHSRLRTFMACFHGIASKYLYRYVAWFSLLRCNCKTNSESIRLINRTLVHSSSNPKDFDYSMGRTPLKNNEVAA